MNHRLGRLGLLNCRIDRGQDGRRGFRAGNLARDARLFLRHDEDVYMAL